MWNIDKIIDPRPFHLQRLVLQLQAEINELRNELAMHDTLANRSHVSYEPLSEQQLYEVKQQVMQYVEGRLDEVDVSPPDVTFWQSLFFTFYIYFCTMNDPWKITY